ncbi:hypothetical protein MLD38_038644 [Melastoma candidum]|uniref:Uncharacterized protein n=1 Tax=Melastoma candidum TaxID=119954 RepID=A0ACB9L058_9MYRT|nr:hypothetical protein MLD38_038644 [Melastoma candidum]
MASSNNTMTATFIVVIIAISALGSHAICNVSIDEVETCLPAVTRGRPTNPTGTCCSVLKRADLPCLCGYKTSIFIPSYVDINLAMGLPSKCGLRRPANC